MRYSTRAVLYLTAVLSAALLLTACHKDKGVTTQETGKVIEDISTVDTTYKVYYLGADGLSIDGITYSFVSETPRQLIGECLERLSTDPGNSDDVATIKEPIQVVKYEYDETSKQADIYFNDAYQSMTKSSEILFRAAVVKTLTQFDSVIDYVRFFAGENLLTEPDGRPLIMMQSDFVDSTSADIKNLNEKTFKLYFASSDGTQLAPEDVYVHYLKTAPVEKVVMESIITGPLSENLNRTCSSDTKLYKISVTDGVCYVDLNQKFLEKIDEQSFKVKVYSVVNSLCALDTVDSVQLMIDNKVQDLEMDGVNIGAPLKADSDIVVKPVDTPPVVEKESKSSLSETAQ